MVQRDELSSLKSGCVCVCVLAGARQYIEYSQYICNDFAGNIKLSNIVTITQMFQLHL